MSHQVLLTLVRVGQPERILFLVICPEDQTCFMRWSTRTSKGVSIAPGQMGTCQASFQRHHVGLLLISTPWDALIMMKSHRGVPRTRHQWLMPLTVVLEALLSMLLRSRGRLRGWRPTIVRTGPRTRTSKDSFPLGSSRSKGTAPLVSSLSGFLQ